jgi:hypothetical protein
MLVRDSLVVHFVNGGKCIKKKRKTAMCTSGTYYGMKIHPRRWIDITRNYAHHTRPR